MLIYYNQIIKICQTNNRHFKKNLFFVDFIRFNSSIVIWNGIFFSGSCYISSFLRWHLLWEFTLEKNIFTKKLEKMVEFNNLGKTGA